MIPGSQDRAPYGAPCSAGSLLLPLTLPLLVFPLLQSLSVKYIFLKKEKETGFPFRDLEFRGGTQLIAGDNRPEFPIQMGKLAPVIRCPFLARAEETVSAL